MNHQSVIKRGSTGVAPSAMQTAPNSTKVRSVHPLLIQERQQATFRTADLTNLLYGPLVPKIQRFIHLFSNSQVDMKRLWNAPAHEQYLIGCELAESLIRIIREYNLIDDQDYISALQVYIGHDFFVMLHLTMFLPALEMLCSEEQREIWIKPAKEFKILGTYAQTELGHGSNVAGLETTATFDPQRDEWVLNSPNLSSTKWWPGGLAKSATHCILMARLILKGKDYGTHAFILPVRDLQNHQPLPGIVLLDIGTKMGYNGMDNGAMRLNHVRIPRTYLLSRFYLVDREGNYTRLADKSLLYGTMTFTRKQIIYASGVSLAKSVTIAIRYSVIRKQFAGSMQDIKKDPLMESQVLNYSSQQYALFPCVATAILYLLTGNWVSNLYEMNKKKMEKGDLSELSHIHLITSALKGTMTKTVCEMMEICRRSCGGHGYLLSSGLAMHLNSYLPQATYEGDFVVLSIQAGRILLKTMQNRAAGKTETGITAFLYQCEPATGDSDGDQKSIDFEDFSALLSLFQNRCFQLVFQCALAYQSSLDNTGDALLSLDDVKIEMTRMALAFSHVLILNCAMTVYSTTSHVSSGLHALLRTCIQIYALHNIENTFGEFVATGCLKATDLKTVTCLLKEKFKLLRRDVVSTVDAFWIPDHLLNSTLGCYDGHVYESLWNSLSYSPLNLTDVSEGYYRHIQYILHPERKNQSKI